MVDPVTSYNRVPPPIDPESRDSHLDGELGRLEQSTASIIARLGTAATDLTTAVASLQAADAAIITNYAAADVVVTNAFTAADAAESTARNAAIAAAVANKVVNTRLISAGTGLTGGGDLSADRTLTLANTAVTPASYTFASITVDQQGRLTAASSGSETWSTAKQTADQTRNSSIVWTDAMGLTLPVVAGTYAFEFFTMMVTGAGGIMVGVNGPTLVAMFAAIGSAPLITTYDTSMGTLTSGNSIIRVHGQIEFSAAGTFAVRIRQNTSDAAASTLKAGAWLRMTRIA